MFIDKLPEIVRAVSEPLSRTEKIVMISSGGSEGVGPAKLSKEIIDVVTQVPPMLEAVTGVSLDKLIQKIHDTKAPGGDSPGPAAGPAAGGPGKGKPDQAPSPGVKK
jgi:hypothetical protein